MALAVIGLLAFVDSFLHWADLSLGGRTYSQFNWNGWNAGLGAWLPMLLLLALGALAALPAFGRDFAVPLGLPLVGAVVGALSFVIIVLRWITLPSEMGASMSAAFGLYIGLVLAIAATVFGWLDYRAGGGDLKSATDSLKQAQGSFRNQPPQGGGAPYQQGQQPYDQPPAGRPYDPNQGGGQPYDPNQGGGQPYDPNQGGGRPYNQG
ncbi:hypothetical protein [Catenulispora pinisilvae]|uniref:hypothetical protein n=1 Tax=Catenulispora pinisilvae TaxID=2705253 RepID=UPI001890F0B2|nr:hypothetical protein [Catenulispora pinisilvae]